MKNASAALFIGTMTTVAPYPFASIVNGCTGYIMSPTCTPFQHPAAETFRRNYMEWLEAAVRVFG